MNVILQAWAATPSVVRWLEEWLNKNKDNVGKGSLAPHLLHTLHVVNQVEDEPDDVHSPASIIGALRSHRWIISHEQQDAHELFNVLTTTLDEQSKSYPSTPSCFDLHALQMSQRSGSGGNQEPVPVPHMLRNRDNDSPFRMLIASQMECIDCKYRHPVRYDLNSTLSLAFPKTAWKSIKLESLLQKFITSEIVHNVECPGCRKVQQQKNKKLIKEGFIEDTPKSSCLKRHTIGKLPQCLCLHMQRTQWLDSGIPLKKYEHVVFPETLHMDDYVYTKCESRNGLLGGKALFGNTVVPLPTVSPLTSPTSGHLTLLRALNYDSRISTRGLSFQSTPPSPPTANQQSDINHNSPKSSQDYTFKLTSVVMHLGDVFSGHFVTYRRSLLRKRGEQFSSQWLCTSDHAVKEVSLEEVLATEAYMLFYERES
ncbi:ubiquitin carboxyl-terminal hydrolase 30-like [Dreissena polymorpha]|uniref:ubiquitinyl hydrolase 1 n=1 Tax=Dreissena polymorpha TaxID=45954 RepID=A0A9D4NEV4_DREPO|nr:ubiquitin carboxyl-terminal hydrolase 30-like [Dreissena polymorpha]KAH3894140.1 hypothetical protein DPMN_018298 [Dreissena polymorpha]